MVYRYSKCSMSEAWTGSAQHLALKPDDIVSSRFRANVLENGLVMFAG